MKMLLALVISMFATISAHAMMGGGVYSLQECSYDFAVKGGAVGTIDLCGKKAIPAGSYIVSGFYTVEQAFTSGGAATVALGDAASSGRYLAATSYSNAAFALNNIAQYAIGVPFYADVANKGKLSLTIAGAALTAGKLKMMVLVYKPKL